MKVEKDIRENKDAIVESEVPLDDYMKGYVSALRWVLEEY